MRRKSDDISGSDCDLSAAFTQPRLAPGFERVDRSDDGVDLARHEHGCQLDEADLVEGITLDLGEPAQFPPSDIAPFEIYAQGMGTWVPSLASHGK
jgi:hypothetical protein